MGGLFFQRTQVAEFELEALPHMPDLYRTARRVLGNEGDAEDLVQEAYLQAWKSFHRYQPGTNCRAWLYKILFHRIHHFRRKRFSFKIVQEAEEILKEMVAFEPPVPEHLTDEEILSAIDSLPPGFREVLLLADVEEFAYKEISEILKIPIGTVMSRLNRARRTLRGELSAAAGALGIGRAAGEGKAS